MKDDEGRPSHACHFERKRELFFVCGHERNGRASENGKHGTPYAPRSWRFIREGKQRAVNEKSTLGGAWEANLRPFGAPPSIGRRESRVPASLPHTVISSASEKSFSFAVMKEIGGHRKTGNAVLHTLWDHGVSFAKGKASGQRKKRPRLCLGR